MTGTERGGMIRWIRGLWYARMRRLDLEILWPATRAWTISIHDARAVFAGHALRDPAWLFLGKEEVWRIIDNLN